MLFRLALPCIALALLWLPLSVLSQVTGRVLNDAGKPVSRATVTYTNLSSRLTWTFAAADGTFSLPDPTVAPWNPPDTTRWSYINTPSISLQPGSCNPAIAGGFVYLNTPGIRPITLTLLSPSGKIVMEKQIAPDIHGRFSLPLDGLFFKTPACGLYLLHIRSGSESHLLPFAWLSSGRIAASRNSRKSVGPPKMIRNFAAAGIDQIRVGRTFHFPVIKPINSYTQNMGDIMLTGYDVEARIDSVIAAAADSPYVYLNQCIMHNEWDSPEASSEKSAGAHFMAGHVMP